jgi:hypothetical protein
VMFSDVIACRPIDSCGVIRSDRIASAPTRNSAAAWRPRQRVADAGAKSRALLYGPVPRRSTRRGRVAATRVPCDPLPTSINGHHGQVLHRPCATPSPAGPTILPGVLLGPEPAWYPAEPVWRNPKGWMVTVGKDCSRAHSLTGRPAVPAARVPASDAVPYGARR